jgi:hypothetical protein
MKVQKANCGASVKANRGGYMKIEKTGYNQGGMASSSKSKSDGSDKSKFAKRAEGVQAADGGMAKKKTKKKMAYNAGGSPQKVAMKTCSSCPTPGACASAGRCKKSGKKLQSA